ncbi:MAG: metallophosphatase [Bacteroidaceae bacterium]|nr:metallophosphatase [Bacteroidaceae bacterium]
MKKFILLIALFAAAGVAAQGKKAITILHTNDTHSTIDQKDGNPGAVDRALVIEHVRDSVGAGNMLLFDCGDFSQGSLYYNIHKGAVEVEIMNAMGYDACAIGNHEFDFGLENMARIFKMAKFPIVCANYDFTGTPCEGIVKPYVVIERAGKRIGVFGLSPDFADLVSDSNSAGVRFVHPAEAARKAVEALEKEKCDVIICLSHLGWKDDKAVNSQYNDEYLAANTAGIDVILGGHSHNYFEKPVTYTNADGKPVIVQQMGSKGRYIGYVTIAV